MVLFADDLLEDQVNRDIEIPKKSFPWVRYFLRISLPTLIVSSRAAAQQDRLQPRVAMVDASHLQKEKKPVDIDKATNKVIIGKVLDDNGNPIPYATVLIKGTKKGVAADSLGGFTLEPKLNWKTITLSISCVGFAPFEATLKKPEAEDNLLISLKRSGLLGEVTVINSYRTYRTGMVGSVRMSRFNQKKLEEPLYQNFRVYPNPVRFNSSLLIEWTPKEAGEHIFELFNQSGQLALSKEIYIEGEQKVLEINIPFVRPAIIFCA